MTDDKVTGMQQVPGDTPPSLPTVRIVDDKPPQNDSNMKNRAEGFAEALVLQLQRECGIRVVVIHDGRLQKVIEEEITRAINREFPPMSTEERERLKTMVGIPAYLKRFQEVTVKRGVNAKGHIEEVKEETLSRLAIADKRNELARQRQSAEGKIVYHKRDLGVLRVMDVYGISVREAIEGLERIHTLTDKYELYYGSDMVWPTDATFH